MPIYPEKYTICTLCWNMRKLRQYAKYAAIAYSHKTGMPSRHVEYCILGQQQNMQYSYFPSPKDTFFWPADHVLLCCLFFCPLHYCILEWPRWQPSVNDVDTVCIRCGRVCCCGPAGQEISLIAAVGPPGRRYRWLLLWAHWAEDIVDCCMAGSICIKNMQIA